VEKREWLTVVKCRRDIERGGGKDQEGEKVIADDCAWRGVGPGGFKRRHLYSIGGPQRGRRGKLREGRAKNPDPFST